ncbi:hypothetical protein M9H77_06358 [Catharanthus roseus]|uniref:Uncharacterized protein n=1 Tax=Catharanthus roseus TaxID=4058 RepID=A0ACC0BS20_CATRO|nr:hypothetical protein M9H77_06358 [Catharanthus roseus]
MEHRCFQEEAGGGSVEPSTGCGGQGSAYTPMGLGHSLSGIRVVHPTASAKGTVGQYVISRILGEELKANTKRLHIKTGSPMPTDKQLMFEATGGSNKGHAYGFGSQFAAITAKQWGGSSSSSAVPSVSSAAAHDACIERERRLWGYMQQT